MTRERGRVRNDALLGLDSEIALRRAELACLERARDTIARTDAPCDSANGTPCSTVVYTELCRVCGYVSRHCSAHLGKRAATVALRYHEHQEHGAEWAHNAAPDDASGVLGGRAAVPVGRVSASPASDGDGGGTSPLEPSDGDASSESRTAGQRTRGGGVDR